MEKAKRTIAVTGATGQQGGHLARRLLNAGHQVRALTRHPGSPAATALAALGADVRPADLDQDRGLREAFAGADALFIVTTPFERGADAEVIQARHAGRAARASEVGHVVYSSVTGPMTQSPIAHFRAKGAAERVLEQLDLPLTIIGAPPFLDNVVAPWHLPWLRQGIFAVPGPLDVPMQMVAAIDIAGMAAAAIEQPGEMIGHRVDIASDEISARQMMEILGAALGGALEHRHMSFAELDPTLGELFAGIEGAGPLDDEPGGDHAAGPQAPPPTIDIANLHAAFPEVGWHRFADWVAMQNWAEWLRGSSR